MDRPSPSKRKYAGSNPARIAINCLQPFNFTLSIYSPIIVQCKKENGMKYIFMALVLISVHVAVHHSNKRVHIYAADYYYGSSSLNHDFQLQEVD